VPDGSQARRTIVAMGGGGFSMEPDNPLLDDHVLANCWFESATTDSFGPLAALKDGLGLLPGSHLAHYDGEPARRPTFQRLIGAGELPDGYAADDGAALVFHGTELAEVVASRPTARGYRVVRGPNGEAIETQLPTRYLG